jgi:hypothetical protein
MKTLFKNIGILGAASIALISCDPKIDTPTPSVEGKIDVSNYIAIGNSITAGYASNGLYLEGQKVAYPVLIAQQLKLAGGGEFNAPLFAANESDGTGYLRLDRFLSPTSPILIRVDADPDAIAEKSALAYNSSLNPDSVILKPYIGPKNHNWGVPGIRVADIETPGYGYPNSYFGRMLTDGEKLSATYSAKVLAQNPTFFTCWLGNNDVLGYSTAGGYVDLGKITNPATFTANYTNLINNLTNLPTKPKGVLGNIPDVTSLPFFTTVGPSLKAKLSADGDTNIYEFKFDSIFQNTVVPVLLNPDPAVVILNLNKVNKIPVNKIASLGPTGEYSSDVFLTLTFSSYTSLVGDPGGKAWRDIIKTLVNTFVLPPPFDQIPKDQLEALAWTKAGLDTTKPFGVHPLNPIPDVFVLNPNETAQARNAVANFNNIIKTTAESKGLAYVDANSYLKNITKGAYYDAISTNASFLSGGAFSLDGIHLTPRGNALAANEFIKAINEKYKTKITVLNPGQYRGVTFP